MTFKLLWTIIPWLEFQLILFIAATGLILLLQTLLLPSYVDTEIQGATSVWNPSVVGRTWPCDWFSHHFVRMNIYSEFHLEISFLYFKSPDTPMYLQYYLFFNSDVYTSEWAHSYQHVYVRESGMHLQLKKQNEDLVWIGLGLHTKHAWKLDSSVQTGGWMVCLIYQVHVHVHETCGNAAGEGMCVCAGCEGESWGEGTTSISALFFSDFLCSV